jgi:uncharacterized protein YbjT (DUF2867 family)
MTETGKVRAVLAGATGLVGRYLLETLLEDAYYDHVTVLTRRPKGRTHPRERLTEYVGELDSVGEEAFAGATHLFCALGTTIKKAGSTAEFKRVDYELPLRLGALARRAGARCCLLVSSVGASASAAGLYLKTKGELERELTAQGWPQLDLFRPSILLGKREESRPGERWATRIALATEWMMGGPLSRYRPMPAGLLASAMAAAGERGAAGVHVHHYQEIRRLAGV